MARSRVEEWREEHQRRKVRTAVIISVTAVLLVLFLLHRWYVSIHATYWDNRDYAVTEAVYAGELGEVISVEQFNGDEPWFIVRGIDADGDERLVWVAEERTAVRYSSDGLSEEEARQVVWARQPDAKIIRVTPGVWMNELCYEIYYHIDDADGAVYYYDYIRFEDGEWIETLRLGR